MTTRRKTVRKLPAIPSNQEQVTVYIPAGQEIEFLEGAPAKPGYVRIRWTGYSEPVLSLFVLESDLKDLTE